MNCLLKSLLALIFVAFSAITFAQAIDINTATAEQLDKGLKGIGPKKAADIVKYREAHGPFQSVDDLTKVPGIKAKTLNPIKPMLSVGGAGAAVPATPAVPAIPAKPAMPAMPTMPTAPAIPAVSAPAMPAKPAMPTMPAAPTTLTTPPTLPTPPKQ